MVNDIFLSCNPINESKVSAGRFLKNQMKKGRLEAFSDGVLAIIITIMVLEMEIPSGADFTALKEVFPVFSAYAGSFVYLGIYWNNHHHLLQVTEKVTGGILWANLNLLFWLSLFPFATAWLGSNHLEEAPVALYGIILLLAAIAYKILVYFVVKNEGENSLVGKYLGNDKKEIVSILLYCIGVIAAFFEPVISYCVYILVAVLWFIPDTRIEKHLE